MAGQDRLKGVQFTGEPSTSGRVLAPVPTLLATHSRGNHGGIAPTKIGESANGKRRRSRPLQP
ncbi:hypothetical protein [Prochlorothrix hollandica]|uniref:hypothetical protein n=1 Tax=Prochlorothrix hollandica TaxID=1223 RepID=UPI0009D9B89F|nr:hypothetical protein [Prochlorothrix hollandica]